MIFAGTIITPFTAYGMATVMATLSVKSKHRMYLGVLPMNGTRDGMNTTASFPAGQSVLCWTEQDGNSICYIISAMNTTPSVLKGIQRSKAFFDLDNVYAARDELMRLFRINIIRNTFHTIRDRGQNMADDTYSGDIDISSVQGTTGLHLSELVAMLKASPLASIDLTALNNRVRLFGENVEALSLTGERVLSELYSVDNIAYSANEALGSVTYESPLVKQEKTGRGEFIQLNDGDSTDAAGRHAISNVLPFFRFQEIAGGATLGAEQTVYSLSAGGMQHVQHTPTDEPVALSRTRRDIDGTLRQDSINGLISVKAPAIYAVQQFAYSRDGVEASTTTDPVELRKESQYSGLQESAFSTDAVRNTPDVLKSMQYKKEFLKDAGSQPSEEALEEIFSDATLFKLADILLSDAYRPKLVKKLAEAGLGITSLDSTMRNTVDEMSYANRFKPTCTDKYEYDLPAHITLDDTAAETGSTVFNSTSFISQEPDGSIVLCDGYGSEIRMSRGHIYISPALDIHIRPGRDMDVMAGRHQSYNSQDSCTLNTGAGMFVRSAGQLNMVGGTSEKAMQKFDNPDVGVIIESYNDMLVKSGSQLTVGTAKDFNITVGSQYQTSNGEYIKTSTGAANFTLNVNGAVHTHSTASTHTAESVFRVTVSNGSNGSLSVMQMDCNNTYLIFPSVYVTGNILVTNNIDASEMYRHTNDYPDNGKSAKAFSLSINALKSKPSVVVAGSIISGADVRALGSMACMSSLVCQSVSDLSGAVGKTDSKSLDLMTTDITKITDKLISTKLGDITGKGYATQFQLLQQAAKENLKKTSFSFPSAYTGLESSGDITIRCMAWQALEQLDGTAEAYWTENPVYYLSVNGNAKLEAMPYPGAAVWRASKLSASVLTQDSELHMDKSYIINNSKPIKS